MHLRCLLPTMLAMQFSMLRGGDFHCGGALSTNRWECIPLHRKHWCIILVVAAVMLSSSSHAACGKGHERPGGVPLRPHWCRSVRRAKRIFWWSKNYWTAGLREGYPASRFHQVRWLGPVAPPHFSAKEQASRREVPVTRDWAES